MRTIRKLKIKSKMIHVFILLAMLLVSNLISAQQNLQDVVYLKNGSIIHGTIIEQVPGKTIKIQTADKNVFVYAIDEIEKITKEPISDTQMSNSPLKKTRQTAPQEIKRFSVLVNPLGFLQFGPYIQGEIKFLPNTVFSPHYRFAGLGLLTHAVSDYYELYASSAAIGFGVKQFIEPNNSTNRIYIGAYFEEGWTRGSDETVNTFELVPHHCQYNTFTVNFGYRWRFSKFFINAGALGGLAVETWDGNDDQGAIYPNDTYLIGMLEFSFGFEF